MKAKVPKLLREYYEDRERTEVPYANELKEYDKKRLRLTEKKSLMDYKI